jgi:4-amino-4-deoxy-L-arabinose transferase-like glycosyltransferase
MTDNRKRFLSKYWLGIPLSHSRLPRTLWDFAGIFALLLVALLAFYNLEYNPMPCRDEGGVLLLARTFLQDGVYAVRSSEGYDTFGPVQSVGPTVILPVALSFRLFGVGLKQGRFVAALYLILTFITFYLLTRELFGPRAALLVIVLLFGGWGGGIFIYGRSVLGEVPALGFFLAGWLCWVRSVRARRSWLWLFAGLFIGAAMVTKSHYAVVGGAALSMLLSLECLYYRQGNVRGLLVMFVVALTCLAFWWGAQLAYYGVDTFLLNVEKMRLLSSGTTGFYTAQFLGALEYLHAYAGGSTDKFWCFLSFVYVVIIAFRRDQEGLNVSFLVIFAGLWFCYWLLWIVPWELYALPALAIMTLFVTKAWSDLTNGFSFSWSGLRNEAREGRPGRMMATLILLLALAVPVSVSVKETVKEALLRQLHTHEAVAAFINANIPKDAIIELWDREVAIMTDHNYHIPGQLELSETRVPFIFHNSRDKGLGKAYFEKFYPSYLVLGSWARQGNVYDMKFVANNSHLLASIGEGTKRYDIYRLKK